MSMQAEGSESRLTDSSFAELGCAIPLSGGAQAYLGYAVCLPPIHCCADAAGFIIPFMALTASLAHSHRTSTHGPPYPS